MKFFIRCSLVVAMVATILVPTVASANTTLDRWANDHARQKRITDKLGLLALTDISTSFLKKISDIRTLRDETQLEIYSISIPPTAKPTYDEKNKTIRDKELEFNKVGTKIRNARIETEAQKVVAKEMIVKELLPVVDEVVKAFQVRLDYVLDQKNKGVFKTHFRTSSVLIDATTNQLVITMTKPIDTNNGGANNVLNYRLVSLSTNATVLVPTSVTVSADKKVITVQYPSLPAGTKTRKVLGLNSGFVFESEKSLSLLLLVREDGKKYTSNRVLYL